MFELIEVIAIKDNKAYKSIMTISEWKTLKKKKGYRYIAYQLGFSNFVLN